MFFRNLQATKKISPLAPLAGALALVAMPASCWAEKPGPSEALEHKPLQADVDYDRPAAADIAKCTVEIKRIGGLAGFVVSDENGQVLRHYLDSNGDNSVDQWCYFKNGVEVYRDIDSDFNKTADQHRWLGTAGTRWGIDANEDKRIDYWKVISPEEVTAEVVAAIRTADSFRFERLLLSTAEIDALGLSPEKAQELKAKAASAAEKFSAVAKRQKLITPKTEWLNFGASQPGTIPAGTDGSTKDVMVYDNVTAVIETPSSGDRKHGQLLVGSLVRSGDAWHLLDLPQSLAEDPALANAGGFFFLSSATRSVDAPVPSQAVNISADAQKLIDEINKLDSTLAQQNTPAKIGKVYQQRADLLEKLAFSLPSSDDRVLWLKQYADALAQGLQSGGYTGARARLKEFIAKAGKLPESKDVVPYARFHLLQAEYNLSLQEKDANYEEINNQWLKDLEAFVKEYPASEDSAEAVFQLAVSHEFAQQDEVAAKWWARLAQDFPKSPLAPKAAGAQRRLSLEGKPFALKGKLTDGKPFDISSLSGKTILVHFWSTEYESCVKDLDTIRALQAKYGKDGFVPVGINLDRPAELKKFMDAKRLAWPQLYAEGGLDTSPLAVDLGIHALPMMILVGKDGKVVRRSIYAGELESELKRLLR